MKLKNCMRNCKAEGTITVFLSLILLIILSLVFTIIEGARVYTARVMAVRALGTAMDSVLAEYYGPLWEEYHVFGHYCEGDPMEAREVIQNKLSNYINYTFDPGLDLKNNYSNETELYHLSIKDINVSKEATLLDYEGQLLINEAVEYMKYQELGDGAEALLQKLKLLQTPNKVSYIMDEKQELQEELVQIDKGILKLMMLFDGIETSDQGIKLTKQGSLKTTNYFIKKVCNQEITMQQVGINQRDVFTALKDHYINTDSYFGQIESYFLSIEAAKLMTESLRNQIAIEIAAMSEISRSLSSQPTKAADDEEGHFNEIVKQFQALQDSIQRKETIIVVKEKEITDHENQMKTICRNLLSIVQNTKPLILEAISCINNLQGKVKVAAPLVNEYEKLIIEEKENLETRTYAGLEEGLEELKKYVESGNLGYNLDEMKQILVMNDIALEQANAKITEGILKLSLGEHQYAASILKNAKQSLNTYQISGLVLDYSTLVLDQSNQASILDHVKQLTESGLVSLVVDPSSISKASLKTLNSLPSGIAKLKGDNTDTIKTLKEFFQSTGKETSSSNSKPLFQSLGNEIEVDSILITGINKVAEIYLFEEYLREHFSFYQGQDSRQVQNSGQEQNSTQEQVEKGSQTGLKEITQVASSKENVTSKESSDVNKKPSVLKYEQEYLVTGKSSDQENQYAVITKIMLIRTLLDFITVISDSSAREKAKAAAITIVGFTGLPILIGAVQIMIMMAWALEEALLDTCAIMNQKEVPFIKRKTSLQFHELFMISRTYLEKKIQETLTTNDITFGYQQYLQLFLLMGDKRSLSYRSMDLMQENIKLRYELDTFEMEDCYFGFFAEVKFKSEPVFTKFSFVQNYISQEEDNFSFMESLEYSY